MSSVCYFFPFSGGSLQDHIDDRGCLGVSKALTYAKQILQALTYLQQKYVLHEDIKADNILLRAESLQLVLADFGLSRQLAPQDPFVTSGEHRKVETQQSWWCICSVVQDICDQHVLVVEIASGVLRGKRCCRREDICVIKMGFFSQEKTPWEARLSGRRKKQRARDTVSLQMCGPRVVCCFTWCRAPRPGSADIPTPGPSTS